MLAVLWLFLIPVGGGIPAGVLLAQSKGLPWSLTTLLYLLSDVILALCFEPALKGFVALGRRIPWMARFGAALRMATERTVTQLGGAGAGPLALVLIAFGVDPMTGRTAALAAGYGIWAGWSLAILGDLLYYGVVALATLRLNAWIRNPNLTVGLILAAMILVPSLVRRLRTQIRLRRVTG